MEIKVPRGLIREKDLNQLQLLKFQLIWRCGGSIESLSGDFGLLSPKTSVGLLQTRGGYSGAVGAAPQ